MKILLIGKGSHANVVKSQMELDFAYSDDIEIVQVEEGDVFPLDDFTAFIGIGSNEARERISKQWPYRYMNVGADASLQEQHQPKMMGCFFGRNSFIGNNSKVGNFCIVNTGVIFEHDSTLGDYSHLAPGVVTGGRVKIGSRTTIGLNSTIRDGVTIGDDCIIGQGSNVTKSIPDNEVWYGNPARFVRVNK